MSRSPELKPCLTQPRFRFEATEFPFEDRMPTISIPYFNLAEPEVSPKRPNEVWNEVRVPFAPSSPGSPGKERYADAGRGNPKPQANLPASLPSSMPSSLPAVVLPQNPALATNQPQSKPIDSIAKSPNSDSDPNQAPRCGKLQQAQVGQAIPQQPGQAIARLTNCILERFPLAGPTIIMFAGSQSNPLTSATCANVAGSLARKNIGKILLVDSSQRRELTLGYQAAEHRGVSNLLTDCTDWRSTVITLASSGMEFLPAGNSHWEHWGAENKLRQLAAEIRRQYQFICVAVDDPHQANSKIWTGICDGSFLLVSQRNANPAVAEANVVELQSNGARLLGCVVTDADSMLP